jgi:hypothetical protein
VPEAPEILGDFTATTCLLPISALAIAIGIVAAFVALALLRLIGLFTNLFYMRHKRQASFRCAAPLNQSMPKTLRI